MNERLVKIEELKELKEKYLKAQEEQKNESSQISDNVNNINSEQTTSKEKEGPVLVKANPSAPSLLDKAGFSNIIYLAAMSLMFEVLFLAISFMIYK